jgi:uncharacterized protein with beta-barrel porin domain
MSRSSTSLVLVIVALLTAPLAAAANGAPTDSRPSKHEIRALTLRGEALNRTYHLGEYAGPSKEAIRALTLRGEALNRTYHLGAYAGPSNEAIHALTLRGQALNRTYHLGAYADPSNEAIHALTLRGEALNRTYHLGAYAGRTGSSFPWRTAAFAALATFGIILAAFAGTVGVRRRRAVIAV